MISLLKAMSSQHHHQLLATCGQFASGSKNSGTLRGGKRQLTSTESVLIIPMTLTAGLRYSKEIVKTMA
jgi:hypothetical protein